MLHRRINMDHRVKPGGDDLKMQKFASPRLRGEAAAQSAAGEGALALLLRPAVRPPHPDLLPASGEKEVL